MSKYPKRDTNKTSAYNNLSSVSLVNLFFFFFSCQDGISFLFTFALKPFCQVITNKYFTMGKGHY